MNVRRNLPRSYDRAELFYTLLLLCYPEGFRRTYGTDMRLLFRDCLRDARRTGGSEVLSLWLSTLLDIGSSAPRAHLEEWTTMQASYTRASQWGAIFAIAATALWVYTFMMGDMFAAIGNIAATLVVVLLLLTSFGAVAGLYVRLNAIRPSPLTLAGGVCGLAGLLTGFTGGAGWLFVAENDWSWGTFMISLGVMALGFTLLGIVASRERSLGPLRFAPLLPVGFTVMAIVVVFFYSVVEETVMGPLSVMAVLLSFLGVAGTGILLWTHAK